MSSHFIPVSETFSDRSSSLIASELPSTFLIGENQARRKNQVGVGGLNPEFLFTAETKLILYCTL